MTPAFGRRLCNAMLSASKTSSVCRLAEKAQPTTLRVNASMTTARKRKPIQVGRYVMSAT